MGFTLSHIFKLNTKQPKISPNHINGNIRWYLYSKSRDENNINVSLFGEPLEGSFRPGVHWKISADVEGTTGTTKILNKKHNFSGDGKKENAHNGSIILKQNTVCRIKDRKAVADVEISVNLKIRNIETEGIRVFNIKYFESNLIKTDFAFTIVKKKLCCLSQYLSLGSPVFADLLTKKKYSEEDPLEIELDSEMSVEDFKEFLHQLYFAVEPIREDNWEILLHFAGKYEVAQILFCCEKFLLEKLLGAQPKVKTTKAIEMLSLSCRYGMEILKSKCFDCFVESEGRNELPKILTNKHYLAMDETKKLNLLETLLMQTF